MKTTSLADTLRRLAATALLSAAALSNATPSTNVSAPIALDPTVNEQIVMLPVTVKGMAFRFETTLFKPPGNGPFPLLVMNHGKDRGNSHQQARDRFLAMSREFVRRGYAVAVPMRKGFAGSTGNYNDYGCNMKDNGLQQADDVEAALNALVALPWVDREHILIAGQSYGGLATIAFGTRAYPGVRGLLNFAGGLRIDGNSCDWKRSLVSAFAYYGAKSALPSLWFYGENDSYFAPDLAQQLQLAYQSAGGTSQLVAFGAFKSDAHGMVGSRDGVPIWMPEVEHFLKRIGMPSEVSVAIADTPHPPATNFAATNDVTSVPFIANDGRNGYRDYLAKSAPRAFAISGSGAWSWAEEGDDPASRAIASCQKHSKLPCQLYSIDQDVVWSEASMTPPVAVNSDAPSR